MDDRNETTEQLVKRLKEELETCRETEKALRETVRRVRAIFDQTFQHIGLLTPDGTLIEINRAPLRFAGIEKEDVLGKPFWEAPWWSYSPELQERIREAVDAALKGEFVRFEVCLLDKDKIPACIDFSLKPVRDESERIVFLIPEGRDITELKKAEHALQESEERLQAILDNSPVVIYVKDPQGHYRLVNRSFEELFHVERDSFLGKADQDVFSKQVAKALCENDRKVLESGRALQVEEMVIHDEGPHSYISVKFPLRNVDGEIYAVCGISSDITERKKMEDAHRESERRVRAINKELEAFAYSVSHDLRAPLRAIKGFSEVLLEDYHDKLDEDGKKYLRYLQEGSRDMGELIDGLLKLSRSTRGEMTRESVDLSSLVAAVIEQLRQTEPSRELTVHIAQDVQADADPRLLKVVMENLLGNAWKYTGKVADACIEFGTQQQDGETVIFVRDNGAGFDMAYEDKLFMPFQRLHKTGEFSGTGIGLATVQRIIHRHGGRVWAEGAVGKGATFYFTLAS